MTVFWLIVAGVVIREVARTPDLWWLHRFARREKRRNGFGELRTQLLMLVMSGASNGNDSRVFGPLYSLLTVLMRHPDSYGDAARQLLDGPHERGSLNSTDAETERRQLPPTDAEVTLMVQVAHELDELIDHYIPMGRYLLKLHRWVSDKPLWLAVRDQEPVRRVRQRHRPMLAWFHDLRLTASARDKLVSYQGPTIVMP